LLVCADEVSGRFSSACGNRRANGLTDVNVRDFDASVAPSIPDLHSRKTLW
jgi:hypothetical protein